MITGAVINHGRLSRPPKASIRGWWPSPDDGESHPHVGVVVRSAAWKPVERANSIGCAGPGSLAIVGRNGASCSAQIGWGGSASVVFDEADFCQWTVLDPFVEDGCRPRAVGAVAVVELIDEVGKHTTSLRRVSDDCGHGW